jgi:hypothetical protein
VDRTINSHAKKPGVDLKTVRNIHHRVYKKGKVKRAGSEIYVGA